MKIKSTVSFVLASLLVLALGVASAFAVGGYDLSTNNSFESSMGSSSLGAPLRNWYTANTAARYYVPAYSRTGNYAVQVITDDTYPGTIAIRATKSPKKWAEGTTVKVTGWVKMVSDDTGSEQIKLKASFGNGDSYPTWNTVTCLGSPSTGSWHKCEYEFGVPTGYEDIKIEVKAYAASAHSTLYFDDFVVEKCDLFGGGCD